MYRMDTRSSMSTCSKDRASTVLYSMYIISTWQCWFLFSRPKKRTRESELLSILFLPSHGRNLMNDCNCTKYATEAPSTVASNSAWPPPGEKSSRTKQPELFPWDSFWCNEIFRLCQTGFTFLGEMAKIVTGRCFLACFEPLKMARPEHQPVWAFAFTRGLTSIVARIKLVRKCQLRIFMVENWH